MLSLTTRVHITRAVNLSDFDPEFASVADHARELRRHGLQVVPAMPPSTTSQWKRPSIKWREYEDTLVPDAVFEGWFRNYRGPNLGTLTGKSSDRKFVVDLDTHKGPQANQWWSGLLAVHNNSMSLETVEQITGGGGRQLFFRYPPWWKPPTCKFVHINADIRGEGGFVVLAPSLHTAGAYVWAPGCAPWEIEFLDAPQWLMDEIDALAAKYGGKPNGASHEPRVRTETAAPTTISGKLLDGREDYMARLIWANVVDLREESPIKTGTFDEACETTYEIYANHVASRLGMSLPRDDALEAEGRGYTLFRQKWLAAVAQWDGAVKEAAAARESRPRRAEVEYIDPETGEVLGEVLRTKEVTVTPEPARVTHTVFDPWDQPPVPDFPLDTLPPKVAEFIQTTAISTGGDVNAVAMTALVTCATAIDGAYRLKMKRTGVWYVPPRLWVMLVGDPSSKKTPIIQSCMAPITGIERELDAQYRRDMERWKETGKDDDEPEPDKPRRFTANSITVEKVADILSRQGSGITIVNDELGGWIGTLDGSKGRGGEADKGFWAESYNGSRYRTDRIGRGEQVVENLLCNFIGGLQPTMMEKLGTLSDNGLLQRFCPVIMRQGNVSNDVDDLSIGSWDNLIHRLSSYRGVNMIASNEAMEVFTSFERRCNELQRMTSLGVMFCTFVGKLMGLQGSLALILHLIDGGWDEPVSEAAACAAGRILEDFVIPHALAFYRASSDQTNWDSIRSICSYVITSEKDRFTPSDFMAHVRSLRGLSSWDIAHRVAPLVAAGWLDEDRPKGGALKGWIMVEGIRDILAERREEQIKYRREAFEMVSQIGKKTKA